ncbi:hypothetical protein [Mucilaginibacter flavidus]|uniref:hypothetical protein n=1 Tax=Mucilaginibacter flavidus TaxID=2949309 RepID=UPI0020936F6E|nr:hypothetical protein [Mucilaginibacter flavidus]MCO5950499.1 hypothetical protein [Mucilaginibacter flavidus]
MGFPAGRSGARFLFIRLQALGAACTEAPEGRYPRQSLTRVCGYMACGLPERGARETASPGIVVRSLETTDSVRRI